MFIALVSGGTTPTVVVGVTALVLVGLAVFEGLSPWLDRPVRAPTVDD